MSEKKVIKQTVSEFKDSIDKILKECVVNSDQSILKISYSAEDGYLVQLASENSDNIFETNCGKDATFSDVMKNLDYEKNISTASRNAEKVTDELLKKGVLSNIETAFFSRPTFDKVGIVAETTISDHRISLDFANQIDVNDEEAIKDAINNIKMSVRCSINNDTLNSLALAQAITGIDLSNKIENTLSKRDRDFWRDR